MLNHFCKKPLWEVSQTLVAVAGGTKLADTVIRGGKLVNVCTAEILEDIDIAISGLTAADYVAVDVAPASSAVARAANFVATESRAGILRLRAASVPASAIWAQYHIITAATAAKEG